jgi:hypothetical protein
VNPLPQLASQSAGRRRGQQPPRLGRCLAMTYVLVVCAIQSAKAGDDRGIQLGEAKTSTWRFGVVVKAAGGAVTGARATLPVPMNWPEQTVKKVAEDKSPGVDAISYKPLAGGGVMQMTVSIPRLQANDEAHAITTFEITRRQIEAPSDTTLYQLPKPAAALAKYLGPSPYIESKDAKIAALAASLIDKQLPAWDQTAAIFDWVRANVKYEFAKEIKPAAAALNDGVGDCEELSSLFIAICRASKIPARAVWIPEHTYPEFYLLDDKGQGHWFPCQAAGADRQFGSMIEDRPILQKGDNFNVAGSRTAQRYVMPTLSAKDAAAPPEVRFIMEQVKERPRL